MMNIPYSVIIPVYNGEDTLPPCLEALHNQSIDKMYYEVIVVDDGSIDNTADIAKRFNVTYIYQANQGPAAARNKGAQTAQGEIILFTDSDCVPDHNWIKEMVRLFDNSGVVGVKGSYKTNQNELAARFAQAEFEDRYDLLQKSQTIDMVDTYSAAFRKDIFLGMKGFDENFPVANNEDTDLSYRLAAAGYTLLFNSKAFVYHIHPDTFMQYLRVKFWRGYWRMIVYRRFPDKAVKDSYTPAVIKIQTLFMALSFPLFFLSWFSSGLLYAGLLLWVGIMTSSFSFSLKTYKKDKIVGLISPLVILFRSLVFAMGSLSGMVVSLSKKNSKKICEKVDC